MLLARLKKSLCSNGKTGVYTRYVGLDRDTNKELLLKHIRQNNEVGTPFKELQQVLPGLDRNQIRVLMRELRESGKVFCEGTTSAARWFASNDILEQRGKPFNKRKATTDHWYSVAVGSSECQISIDLVNKEHKIRVGLWIADNKERFDYMKQHKTEIEAAMGMALSWERLDNKKSSLICTYIKGLDFKNQENYPELMNKSIDLVVKMRDVLKEYVLAEL